MKLWIVVGLIISAYASENVKEDEIEDKERRVAGGGNYGGFIGLTTYGAGPFLVKGKFERDNHRYIGENNNKEVLKNRNENYDPNIDRKVDNENIQKDQQFASRLYSSDEKRDEDEHLEYLGYRGPRGYCIDESRDNSRKDNIYDSPRNPRNFSINIVDDDVKNRCDKLFGFTGPTANDEPQNLVRPCALDDWQCIRKYFADNSNCKPVYGPIPDPLYIDVNTVFHPIANVTITITDLMVRGLSSTKIRDFYVNKKSGNLVLALEVTNLNETAPRAYFRYRRTAKESIVLADYTATNIRSMTFTAVIPNIPHLRLDLADIHADIHDGTPVFIAGPGAAYSTDPDVVAAFSQLFLLLPLSVREGFLFRSQLYTSIYIQENICDFGLKIISV